jgi:hypothetical protein
MEFPIVPAIIDAKAIPLVGSANNGLTAVRIPPNAVHRALDQLNGDRGKNGPGVKFPNSSCNVVLVYG